MGVFTMLNSVLSALGVKERKLDTMSPDDMQRELIALADQFDAARAKARKRAQNDKATRRDEVSQLTEEVTQNGKAGPMLAALGALTADWDELQEATREEVARRRAQRKWEAAIEEGVKGEKQRARRSRWWNRLLRLGVSAWFVQSLREKDLAEYIDYGAGEQMRMAALGHPIAGYKAFLEEVLIPNARWVALAEVVGTVFSIIGALTGIKRRLAGLVGIAVSGHQLSMNYRDALQRALHGLMIVIQLLALREPHEAEPVSAARHKLKEIPEVEG